MVKEITMYQCEICYANYNSKTLAETCEKRDVPIPRPDLVGVIFGNNKPNKWFWSGSVFSLPSIYANEKTLPLENPHVLQKKLWDDNRW